MSLFHVAVPKFARSLKAMRVVLEKGAQHAKANGIDPSILVNGRLYPNMFPLKKQIQIAVDSARRGCGQLTGTEVPVIEDTEETFKELIARVDAGIQYVESFAEQQFEGSEDVQIELSLSTGTVTLDGTTFLTSFAMANFSFHFVTAYNILRHNGVVLGKMDFLGSP